MCKAPEDRLPIEESWSCDQFYEFQVYEMCYVISGYLFKSMQALIFLCLLISTVLNRCKGRSHIGKLSIWITIMALLNGVFAIVKIGSVFPVITNEQ